MAQQKAIVECAERAATMSIAERRTWAKELNDSDERYQMRKAWFLWATGMLDDDDEPEPRVVQLFADLEALEPRPKVQSLIVPAAKQEQLKGAAR